MDNMDDKDKNGEMRVFDPAYSHRRVLVGLSLGLLLSGVLVMNHLSAHTARPVPDLSKYALIIGEHDRRAHEGAGEESMGSVATKSLSFYIAPGNGDRVEKTVLSASMGDLQICLKDQNNFCYLNRAVVGPDTEDITLKGYEAKVRQYPHDAPLWVTNGRDNTPQVAYVGFSGSPVVYRIDRSAFPSEGISAFVHDQGLPLYHVTGDGGQGDATQVETLVGKGIFYAVKALITHVI
ncbi:hypothetical protein AA14337_3089 [Acetobacter malorum DSM 14337]|uniref:Uncharacterized protein n=1 Tax=Acetobacter malorum DSM 14337 TaxID=1307910 RepID=A0ABQ0PZK2_9PROT|nr:hypothetical protein [Acetobacter malorum]KXV05674.1 hypothetical protein AD930_11100 [Acetobacter malorum]GBQ85506.1 hypothetical protein AA14337_3089 [Acetobacter malorum DSM 14337]